MMRRLAVLALVAVAVLPFAAGAQSTTDPSPGKVVFDGAIASDRRDLYVNAKECADDGELRVTWELPSDSPPLPAGAQYQILASNKTGCEFPAVTSGVKTGEVVAPFTAVATQQTRNVRISAFRNAFDPLYTCTDDNLITVCVRVRNASGTFKDAEGTLELQVEAPPAPAIGLAQVRPADHAFDVTWSAVTGPPAADSYVIIATRVSDPTDVHRQEILFETKGRVGGDLDPTQAYNVQVASVSVAKNEGEPSMPPVPATPISVQDFWERYEGRGGVDDGGCATSGGTGLLAALAALLALRAGGRRRA